MYRKVPFFLFLILAVVSYGQVSLLADTDKKTVKEKERFTLFVIQEINGNELIQETPLRTPDLSRFNVIGQGSVKQTYGDPATNTLINQLIYEFLLEPKNPGVHKIGSFLVTVNGKIYKTEPFDVIVKEEEGAEVVRPESRAQNVKLDMNIDEKELFPNEPTLAIIRAYSEDFNQLRRVGKVHFPKAEHVSFRTVSLNKGNIEQKTSGRSSQVIALAVVIAHEPGTHTVPPVSAELKTEGKSEKKIRSNAVKLQVKEYPTAPPKAYRGAVGNYELRLDPKIIEGPLEVGKPIEVELKVSGKGQLDPSILPRLKETDNYNVFKPEVSTSFTKGSSTMEGEVKAKYLIVPKKPGSFDLHTETFAYLDPEKELFSELSARSLRLTVMTPEEIENAKSTLDKVNEYTNNVLETVNTPVIETSAYKVKKEDTLSWKALLSNYILIAVFIILLLLFYTLVRRMRSSGPKTADRNLGTVREKEEEIRELLKEESKVELSDLKLAAERGDKNEFFSSFEAFYAQICNEVQARHGKDLNSYVEATYGKSEREALHKFNEKIRMEKYAPSLSTEALLELYEKTETIFSKLQ